MFQKKIRLGHIGNFIIGFCKRRKFHLQKKGITETISYTEILNITVVDSLREVFFSFFLCRDKKEHRNNNHILN